jgi:hypothetical protein
MIRKATTRAVCLAAAGILGSTTLFATAAQAAVGDGPGGLTLTPTSGTTHDDPIANFTAANACPADHRNQGAVGFLSEDEFPVLVGLTSNFTPTATPPSGRLDEGTGLADVMAANGLSSGDYQIAVVCFTPTFDTVVPDNVWIHVDLEGGTWNVITGPSNPGTVTTTTTLAANPTTVAAGDPVALTATVSGAGAAGSVEFFDGATSLGTATVSGGTATKSVDTLAAGTHSVTAKFTPTDPNAFTSSTSDAVTVTVNGGDTGGGGNQSGGQQINVTVPGSNGGGDLTLDVAPTPVTLAQQGDTLSFKGDLSPITVTDGRSDLAGWHVDGKTSDFTSGGNSIDGKQLGWAPAVTAQNPAGDVVKGADVAAGNPGLKAGATLASAAAGKGAGASTLGGSLDLEVPDATSAGAYSATLTVTLMGS